MDNDVQERLNEMKITVEELLRSQVEAEKANNVACGGAGILNKATKHLNDQILFEEWEKTKEK